MSRLWQTICIDFVIQNGLLMPCLLREIYNITIFLCKKSSCLWKFLGWGGGLQPLPAPQSLRILRPWYIDISPLSDRWFNQNMDFFVWYVYLILESTLREHLRNNTKTRKSKEKGTKRVNYKWWSARKQRVEKT